MKLNSVFADLFFLTWLTPVILSSPTQMWVPWGARSNMCSPMSPGRCYWTFPSQSTPLVCLSLRPTPTPTPQPRKLLIHKHLCHNSCKMMMGNSFLPHSALPCWGRDPIPRLLRPFVNTEFGRMADNSHQTEPDKLSLDPITLHLS